MITTKQQEYVNDRLNDLQKAYQVKDNDIKFEESKEVEDYLLSVFKSVGDTMLGSTEQRAFVIDDRNEGVIRYLISYLCKWKERFAKQSQHITGRAGSLRSPILLMGEKGVGKTLLMRVASEFTFVTKQYSRGFFNTSSSELMNFYRVNGDLDKLTYNIKREQLIDGYLHSAKPMGVCLHDFGIERDDGSKQKVFGTDMSAVVNDFVMARYELYQNKGVMFHISTNLDMANIIKNYPPRVVDRLKEHNQLLIIGRSRRGL